MSSEELVRKHFGGLVPNIGEGAATLDAIARAARAFVAEEIENTPIGELTLIQQVEFKAGEQEPCGTCGGSGRVRHEPNPSGYTERCPDCNGKERG